jgi:hypothetical protein
MPIRLCYVRLRCTRCSRGQHAGTPGCAARPFAHACRARGRIVARTPACGCLGPRPSRDMALGAAYGPQFGTTTTVRAWFHRGGYDASIHQRFQGTTRGRRGWNACVRWALRWRRQHNSGCTVSKLYNFRKCQHT